MKLLILISLLLISGEPRSFAGQQPPSTAIFQGCAMPLADNRDFLTLCEPHTCSLLRGQVDKKWAGHVVKLRGVLRAATSTQPRTIVVEAVSEIGAACQATCQPGISGRGLGPKDKPQGEGGTPGEAPVDPKPPSQ